MRPSSFVAVLLLHLLVVPSVCAQPPRKLSIDVSTASGKMLQAIVDQTDPAKKQHLMEQFVGEFPKDPGASWIYAQLQPIYLKQQAYDRVLECGEKALETDPDDPEVAFQNLKAAEAKKDPELVKKWSARTSQSARQIIETNKQATEDEKKLLDYATQLDIYTEYSLYALALQMTDPAKTIDLAENLEQRNPKSRYLPKVYGKYLNALRQTGQAEKACSKAEEMVASDPSNEDVLLVAADANLQKRQYDKVLTYAGQLLSLLRDKPKPEALTEADWKRKKDSLVGLAYWMEGVTYGSQGKYLEADKALRAGLPLVTDEELRGMGLFHLGWADYQLGKAAKDKARMLEGLRCSDEAAALKSPVQAQALKNAGVIRLELAVK